MTTVVLNTVTRKVEVFSSARDIQARAEIADHKAAADPHPQYLAEADVADVALSGDAGDLIAGTVPDARMPSWAAYNLASGAALEAANVPVAVDGLRLLGHAAVGDGGGAHYKRVASEPAHPHKFQSADGAWWEELFAADVTVNIPSDFATLQEAIDRLSKQPVRSSASILLNIEAGHALTAGITLQNGDYSHFTVTSDDPEVPLDAGWTAGGHVAEGMNCRMPNWGILVDGGGKDATGLRVLDNSSLLVLDGKGVKNVGVPGSDTGTGLFVFRNSRVTGNLTVFSGCAGHNVWITHLSTAHLERGDFTGSGSTNAAVFLSRASVLYASGANFSDSAAVGLLARRSMAVVIPWGDTMPTRFDNNGTVGISAQQGSKIVAHMRSGIAVELSNCAVHGMEVDGGSVVDIRGAIFTTISFDAMRVFGGSIVVADDVVMSGVGRDGIRCDNAATYAANLSASAVGGVALRAATGAIIVAPDAICSGALDSSSAVRAAAGARIVAQRIDVSNAAGNGLHAQDGGEIVAQSSTGTGCGISGLRAERGGYIVAPESDFSGAVTSGASCFEGSRMSIVNTNLRKGASDDPTDCTVNRGSIVHFWGGTGGTNETPNSINANGLIFK